MINERYRVIRKAAKAISVGGELFAERGKDKKVKLRRAILSTIQIPGASDPPLKLAGQMYFND